MPTHLLDYIKKWCNKHQKTVRTVIITVVITGLFGTAGNVFKSCSSYIILPFKQQKSIVQLKNIDSVTLSQIKEVKLQVSDLESKVRDLPDKVYIKEQFSTLGLILEAQEKARDEKMSFIWKQTNERIDRLENKSLSMK